METQEQKENSEFLECYFCGSDLSGIKLAVIDELKENGGNVSQACRTVGLQRNKFYPWRKKDALFGRLIDEAVLIGKNKPLKPKAQIQPDADSQSESDRPESGGDESSDGTVLDFEPKVEIVPVSNENADSDEYETDPRDLI